eukprot:gnl/MRDRNA2_/MRDRNA2_249084_c0_seq1.p1 gnl/MRDRNA2_/MRDRNA2_249084_c0~~gnl/MRDRNA2_/MRDRNA2_249084_c0_seq1.p1  ORF type:complete len:417 (+),score=62.48 gnl/MRDRNA2_/MRDRNA2_249084_c0_seq1:61-1251(+)
MGPPLQCRSERALAAYPCAVMDLCYTPQASHLVVAGSDHTISSFRLPFGSRSDAPKPLGLGGHTGEISSLCPSYTDSHSTGGGGGPLLLSASLDGTARLWALSGSHAGDDLIVFDRLQNKNDERGGFEKVNDAQFLCLDAAVILAAGAQLGVLKYQLHVQDANDDIQRLRRLGSYKCAGILGLPKGGESGQNIVSLAANNAVVSPTVVVATSSKRICVWDVSAEKELAVIPDAHVRQITCLRLAQPHTEYQTPASLDLFYSAGMDGIVKLWDLRSMKECRAFEGGHQHSAQRLHGRLSPCLRHLCMPSEDGSVCAYDVRSGNILGTARAHRDVVCAVDFHPRLGFMASGGFDGKVQFFFPPEAEKRPRQGRPGGGLLERPPRMSERRVREVEMTAS